MIKMADEKAMMEKVFSSIYEEGKYFTNAELKKRLQEEFDRLGFTTIKAKATLINECKAYEVVSDKKGYRFGKRKLDFNF